MREPARAALDEVSEQLGEVLRRADRLLEEWSAFGTKVREQVDREARGIGVAVANSVDTAVRGVAEVAIAEQLETRLAAVTVELGRVEQRARAASRALADERAGSRRLAWIAIAGVVLANGLLALLLLREPGVAVAPGGLGPTRSIPEIAAPVAPPPLAGGAEVGAPIVDAGVVEVPADAATVPADAAPPAPVVTPAKAGRATLPPRRP